jgi:hypothetical protein
MPKIYRRKTIVLLGLLACLAASAGLRGLGESGAGRILWSIPVAGEDVTLEDVRADGLLLIYEPDGIYTAISRPGERGSPILSLRTVQDGKLVGKISIAGWDGFSRSHPGKGLGRLSGPFRFLKHADRILGIRYPWLVLTDARTGNEIRRALPSEGLTDLNSPIWSSFGRPFLLALALRAQDDAVAIAFNYESRPRIYVYNPDLTDKLHTWQKDRYINNICWSPDGKRLALLYSGKYDQERTFVGSDPTKMPVRLPDVEIIDVESGATLKEFFTGGPESMIAFSPDGSLLYTISEMKSLGYLSSDWEREMIRAFSPETGDLVRTLTVKRTGLRSVLAVSSDGRYLAADAWTPLWHFPLTEDNDRGGKDLVVVLEATTGKVVFRSLLKTGAPGGSGPLFSSDGRLLITGFGPDRSREEEISRMIGHIVAYSLP